MATAKKATAKEAAASPAPATKKAAAKKAAAKAKSAFYAPLKPSKELGAVIGTAPVARTEMVKKIWEYIKKHKLQDKTNKRQINADAKLKAVFGKDSSDMFEMQKLLSKHLS